MRKIRNNEIITMVTECIFTFILSLEFFGMEKIPFRPWIAGIAIAALTFVVLLALKKRRKTLINDYLRIRKEAKAFQERMRKNLELLSTDGLCSGPWDNATTKEEAKEFCFAANIRGKDYLSYVQGKNINEAIGIYLINNPEVSFGDISLVQSLDEIAA